MTDKLYFGATTKCRVKQQPNTFMRNQLLRKLSAFLILGTLCAASFSAVAQIQVGTNGSPLDAFGSIPPASSWSTKTLPGASADPESDASMDAYVNGSTNAASTVTTQVITDAANPPAALTNATWSSSGLYLQTRPTGNAVTLLMATLTNVAGGNVTSFRIKYDYTQKLSTAAVANEIVKGQRVYYSRSGGAGSWIALGDFGNSFTTNVVQAIDILVDVSATPWNASTALFLLFADDNSNPNNDGANAIDNFRITNVVVTPTPPAIIAQPQGATNSPGSSITLNVTASGTPPLYYLWRKNSNAIGSFTTTSSFTINNAQQNDSGFYSVIVSNALGTVTSTNVFVSVQCTVPAGFVAQPTSQTLNSGGTINLTFTSVGTAPLTYQWYRNGVPLATATNAAYTKSNAQTTDSGVYSVVINNCFDSPVTSDGAVVSVADAPYVLMGLTNYFWKYRNEDTNIDLGTVWQGVNYDESGWLSGRGIFGVETDAAGIPPLINTPLILNHAGGVNIITHRMRTTFVLTNDPASVSLTLSNYIDDAAVVYLNSNELFRVNMPGGTVTYLTGASAAGPNPEGTFFVTNFPGTRFLSGTNTLAVEVHQSGTGSSDVDFGMAIIVNYFPSSVLSITNQPQSIAVEEAHPASFTVAVQGTPAYYQWFKNGVAVSNATSNPFTIPLVTTNDAGSYLVVVSNSINSVTSSVAVLTVLTDTNGPTLVSADGTLSLSNVLVTFSEAVLTSTATNLGNYIITNTLGGTQVVTRAVMQNETNVLLTTSTSRTVNNNYLLIANRIKDISPRQNIIATNSAVPISQFFAFFPLTGSSWDFFYGTGEAPSGNWRDVIYDAPANGWANGPSAFAYANQEDLPVTVGTAIDLGLPAYYFRNTFNFAGSPLGTHLLLRHCIDDGAVFYLNGTEVHRTNMASGAVQPDTLANRAVTTITISDQFEIPATALRQGTNAFTVEVHQNSLDTTADQDVVFAAELQGIIQSLPIGPVLITGQPQSQTVVEGSNVTFCATVVAAATTQWQQSGTNVTGATNGCLIIPSVPLGYNGSTFRLVATGTNGLSVTSSVATLTVIADTNRPSLFAAVGTSNQIVVTFSEPVTTSTANAATNYAVTNLSGQAFTVTGASLANGTNATLTFASALPYNTYFVIVNNIRDTSVAGNVIAPNSTLKVGFQGLLVTFTNSWKFNNANVDFGTNFSLRTFDDSSWSTSNALFAAKNGTLPASLPVPVRTQMSRTNNGTDIKTYYFRAHVNSYSSGSGTLTFRTVVDDGCIIYFNGVEVYRLGVGGAADTLGLLANRTVNVAPDDSAAIEGPFSVPVTNVVSGDNVIAVSVHEISAGSSDMYWAGEFSLAVDSSPLPLPHPVQIVTQPRSRTNAVGSAASLYVVATGDPNITYQWRTNGVNLPGQTSSTIILNPIQATNAGNYTVLVANSFSSVTSLVATITVTGACNYITPPAPTITYFRSGTNVVLTWPSSPAATNTCGATALFTLQSTPRLTNVPSAIVWANVTTTSPYTNNASFGSNRFFRLVLLP